MLTQREHTLQTTRPAIQLCHHIRTLLWSFTDASDDLAKDFKLFDHIAKDLFRTVDLEEKHRPEFKINYDLYKRQEQLQQQIDDENKCYEETLRVYEKTLVALETKLKLINQKIKDIETDNHLHLSDVTQLTIRLNEEINNLKNTIESDSHCTKYIVSCFMPHEKNDIKQKIQQLENEYMQFDRNDPEILISGIQLALSIKQEKIEKKLHAMKANPPPKLHAKLVNEFISIRNYLDNGEIKYYSAISNESMFQMIRTYEIYFHLFDRLSKDESLNLTLAHLNKIKQLFIDSHFLINDLFEQFWCPHSNNQTIQFFYKQFLNLSDQEQYRIISGDQLTIQDIETLIPFQEMDSIIIGYHPIGISKKIPNNCKGFS